jgi:hypothetical protein
MGQYRTFIVMIDQDAIDLDLVPDMEGHLRDAVLEKFNLDADVDNSVNEL